MPAIGTPELLLLLVVLVVAALAVVATVVAILGRRSGPARAGRRRPLVDGETLDWLTGLVATTGAAVLAAGAGAVFALFGLASVALIFCVGVLIAAATGWRSRALPLSLVASAAAFGATAANSEPTRLHPSLGLLVARPKTAAEAEQARFTRGLGSVLVDLRDTKLLSDRALKVAARSDAGRVVVALPHDRCVNLRVHARRHYPSGFAVGAARSIAERQGWLPSGELGGYTAGFDAPIGPGSIAAQQTAARPNSDTRLIAYGRSVLFPASERMTWVHRSSDPGAPWIDLTIASGWDIVIRDYPKSVLGRAEGSRSQTYPQLRNSMWPAPDPSITPPYRSRWPDTKRGRLQRSRYRSWERHAIDRGRRRAILAAGPCATSSDLAETWTTLAADGRGTLRVNGWGTVLRPGQERIPTGTVYPPVLPPSSVPTSPSPIPRIPSKLPVPNTATAITVPYDTPTATIVPPYTGGATVTTPTTTGAHR